jgi:prepilin-type N-terminal cleavage/methylation domain-containing protein
VSLPHRAGRGFTLLEMLVTLVIVSLVAGIVWQAMGQLARIERLLEQGQLRSMAQAVRGEWVRSALVSLLPGAPQSGERLRGTASELQGLSAELPRWPTPGLAMLHLRLQHDTAGDFTALQIVGDAPAGESTPQTVTVLLSWPGREGRFRFLDEHGQWQDRWPPEDRADAPALPRAVLLETGLPELRLILAAPQASEVPLPSRGQVEAL